jgi:hypothetical protein
LAAALAFPVGVTTAAAVPVHPGQAAAGEAQPTPPPPEPPPEPEPEPQTPEPPQTPDPPQETDQPVTEPPPTDTEETPASEPGTEPPESLKNLTAEEKKKTDAALDRIEDLKVPAEVKAELKQAVAKVAGALDDPDISPDEKKAYRQILTDINGALVRIENPRTPPQERHVITEGLRALDGLLGRALDEGAPGAESSAFRNLAGNLTEAGANLGAGKTATPQGNGAGAPSAKPAHSFQEAVEGSKDAAQLPSGPDATAVAKGVNTLAGAVATSQNPRSSDDEREDAGKEMDRRSEVTGNPRYQATARQVRSYDASDKCMSTIEARTNQAGWSVGTLWGLSEDPCEEPRGAGAEDTSSPWNKMFVCVAEKSFSTCPAYIPKG